eukprot:761382-Hanusia_phi.AAC.1
MTVIQHKPAPQQMYLPAPQPEKLVGSPEMMVQDPAGGYVQPAYVPTVANGQLGQEFVQGCFVVGAAIWADVPELFPSLTRVTGLDKLPVQDEEDGVDNLKA